MGERARRRRAARDMARRMAELDRLDREYGLGAMPTSSNRPRRERKPHGPVLPGLLITALLLAGIVAWSPAENMESLRRLVGIGDERLGGGAVPGGEVEGVAAALDLFVQE